MRIAELFSSTADLSTIERVAVRCGRAASRVGSLGDRLGRARLLAWPVVLTLTVAEQAAFGLADAYRSLR